MDENENIIEQRIVKEPMIRFNEDSNLIKNYMQYKDTIIVEVSTVGIGGITSKPFREIFTCNKEKTKIWDGKFIKGANENNQKHVGANKTILKRHSNRYWDWSSDRYCTWNNVYCN